MLEGTLCHGRGVRLQYSSVWCVGWSPPSKDCPNLVCVHSLDCNEEYSDQGPALMQTTSALLAQKQPNSS